MKHNDRLTNGQLNLLLAMINMARRKYGAIEALDQLDLDGRKTDELEKWVLEEKETRLP